MKRSDWRAGATVVAVVAVIILAAWGCGGHGVDNFGTGSENSPSPSESPGPSGAAVLIEFVAPDSGSDTAASDGSTVFQSSIGPLGSSNPQGSFVQFRVLNADGRPAKNGIRVLFSVEGPSDAKLTQTKDKTSNGFVGVVLQAGATAGGAVVVAQVDGTNLIARSSVVTIGSPAGAAASIEFFGLRVPGLIGSATDNAGTPTTRTQLGVRGSGFAQAVDVVFAVLDVHGGAAIDGTLVDFQLFGPNGGETIAPTTVASEKGFVSATVTTGTRPGAVEITATVRGTALNARAIPITIGTSLNPPASHLSISAECLNVAGRVTFGLKDTIRAGLSDQFGNPLPIGSAVSFFTAGGGIGAQGISADGLAATADLLTQLPIPSTGRVVVLVTTIGQESFTDLNGNGQWDPGEPFVDQPPEVFLDANENGVYDPGEFFIDSNNNGVYDGTPNGVWDSQIQIADEGPIVFSGNSTIDIQPTSFDVPANGSQAFTVIVADDLGNELVGGTTIEFATSLGTVFPTKITLPDTDINTHGGPIDGITRFTVIVTPPPFTPTAPQPAPSGGTPIPASTPVPKPEVFSVQVTSESTSQTDCPGGNGDASAAVFGTAEQ
jgi:hypothetical protein